MERKRFSGLFEGMEIGLMLKFAAVLIFGYAALWAAIVGFLVMCGVL